MSSRINAVGASASDLLEIADLFTGSIYGYAHKDAAYTRVRLAKMHCASYAIISGYVAGFTVSIVETTYFSPNQPHFWDKTSLSGPR